MERVYETMDMNTELTKKKWNIGLVAITVVTLALTLFLPPDRLVSIVTDSILTLVSLMCCFVSRKKYKVAPLIAVGLFCAILIGFLIAAFATTSHILNSHI